MSGPNDKRRMLDDEMSRFEAEISGPTSLDSGNSQSNSRQIIGSNTFAQVKQQLKQATDDGSLQPPPRPPNFPANGNRPIIRTTLTPQFNIQSQDIHSPQESRPFPPPPGPPANFNRGHFGSGVHNQDGNSFQNMGPGGGPMANSFPPPPPPGFLSSPQGRGGMGGNFPPQNGLVPPPPPPGFIPPQLARSNMNMAAMMNNSGNIMGPLGPRPGSNLLRPPPPPPGLIGQRPPGTLSPQKGLGSATISKGPNIISSAPKLYIAPETKDANKQHEEDKKTVTPSPVTSSSETKKQTTTTEPKKKKLKTDKHSADKKKNATQAMEMAEKVKQSTTTIKQVVNTFHHQPTSLHMEERRRERKPKRNLRYAGGQVWEDQNLAEWDPDDFRLFAGDLGNDVTDELLHRYFCQYPSFVKAKVVRDKRTNKSKGYGFISFKDSQDYIRAMKEMNGKYLGSRPIKLRKSTWKDRNLEIYY
ncbi:RNA-binding protein 42 [Armadillidium vulgare]|nr:RNA-binding protein 42 [Armadillidium vulgare]